MVLLGIYRRYPTNCELRSSSHDDPCICIRPSSLSPLKHYLFYLRSATCNPTPPHHTMSTNEPASQQDMVYALAPPHQPPASIPPSASTVTSNDRSTLYSSNIAFFVDIMTMSAFSFLSFLFINNVCCFDLQFVSFLRLVVFKLSFFDAGHIVDIIIIFIINITAY
ncbi:hypothetical protein CPB84DRAFT_928753 [Gymnopilus junonius]|uniref:Uncharacterized protein n=1 Tax=Gymnopilus junonius TaxID=109634 RepID=A0A9P5NZH7_GYMJU|nr:hypothetical protein CPB84DRAFT_928753 [Gymnopilus junonius]